MGLEKKTALIRQKRSVKHAAHCKRCTACFINAEQLNIFEDSKRFPVCVDMSVSIRF